MRWWQKESEVPNTPAHHFAQKRKGVSDLPFLFRTQAKLHNAEHYSTRDNMESLVGFL